MAYIYILFIKYSFVQDGGSIPASTPQRSTSCNPINLNKYFEQSDTPQRSASCNPINLTNCFDQSEQV